MRLITFGDPGEARLDAVLREAAGAAVTYEHVGSTLQPGPGRYEASVDLGDAPGTFEAAVAGLRAWACHPGIGATVHPAGAPISVGTTVLVVLRVGPLRLLVPDRIVATVDESDRFGFAYGTLPGHPEQGEEAFLLERDGSGRVRATIRVEAVGAGPVTRMGAPVVSRLQRVALRRYLGALAAAVADAVARP